ncbi:MAG: metal ABC transporter permease, partial [Solobacterium sp.]|nr:metal ABC transporter permease [Solobacterium sp.]
HQHLNWSNKITDDRIERLIKRAYVIRDDSKQLYSLTEKGITYVTKQLFQ